MRRGRRPVPIALALALRAEGMAWRDVAQEIAWKTGRRFTFDAVASACYRETRRAGARSPVRFSGEALPWCPELGRPLDGLLKEPPGRLEPPRLVEPQLSGKRSKIGSNRRRSRIESGLAPGSPVSIKGVRW
jgi:hypothetical protein